MTPGLRRSLAPLAAAALLLAVPATALAQRREATRAFSRTIRTSPGQLLRVEHRLGNVQVRTVTGREARVDATIRVSANSDELANRLLGEIDIVVNENAVANSIRTEFPTQSGRSNTSYAVDMIVTVPEDTPLDVRNRFGGVTVDNVKARVEIDSTNGRVVVTGNRGPVRLKTAFGSIDVRDTEGDVDILGASGSVTVDNVRGRVTSQVSFGRTTLRNIRGEAHVTGQSGDVTLADIGGDADLRTTFGSIQADRLGGGLRAITANGTIKVTGIKGIADIRTTFGSVWLRDAQGRVDVQTQNGSVDIVSGTPCQEMRVSTTFGSARIAIPDNVGYNLSARTSFGRLTSDVPITGAGTFGRMEVSGTIAGGGCAMTLQTSSGNLTLSRGTR